MGNDMSDPAEHQRAANDERQLRADALRALAGGTRAEPSATSTKTATVAAPLRGASGIADDNCACG